MKNRKKSRENFKPRHPGHFTRGELGVWLGVSRNSVGDVAERFGLRDNDGRYPEAEVYRKILGIDPRDDQDKERLRRPLEGTEWVSRRTGVPASTVRTKVRDATFGYPLGVQLSETSERGAKPRSRRWIPCVIDALAEGKEPPEFVELAGEPTEAPTEKRADTGGSEASDNIFARIARRNDQVAPQ